MNNNTSDNNQNQNPGSQPNVDPKEQKKQAENQAAEEVGGLVARGAANYFTGGQYEKFRNMPVVGGVAKGLENAAGKVGGKILNSATGGNFGKLAKKAQDTGATDVADKAMGAMGGGAGGAAGGAAKGAAGGVAGGAAGGVQAPKMNASQQQMTKGAQARKGGIATPQGSNNFQDRMSSRNLGAMKVTPADSGVEVDASNVTEGEKEQLEQQAQDIAQQQQLEQKKKTSEKKEKDAEGTLKGFMKNPLAMFVIFFVLVLILVLFIFIYSLISDMDLVGQKIANFSEAEILSNYGQYCTSVTLIKETDEYTGDTVGFIDDVDLEETVKVGNNTINRWEYEEYQLEAYVKGVLQAEALDVADETTFEVASVAARTFTLQIASPQCRIWNNANKNPAYRNPQNFTTDPPAGDISKAVAETSGVVMIKNGNLLDMSGGNYYDYFCFTKKNVENEKEFRYIMLQKNEEEILALPSDWVEENVPQGDFNRSGKYGNECQDLGMSLFGAKYLLNKKSDKYTTIRTLNYYYGYDLEYKKLQTPGAFGGICDGFDLHNTSLTREEFIAAVNSYNGGGKYANLAANAGHIYDLSVANNFNPELVITRAIREGFSGGNNNYWGIGACNGCAGGSNYSSLDQGVLGYINTMNKYNANTLYEVFNEHHYAYIGSSWIQGSSAKGGCYYFPYIKQYYTDQSRVSQVEAACASGNAIPTTDADQAAYSSWQVAKMSDSRAEIFGVSSDCDDPAAAGAQATGDYNNILNSNASTGAKAAQLSVAMFDSFGYSQANRFGNNQVDCSSLVYRTYRELGIDFGGASTSAGENAWCKANNRMISESQLQPGDLLFKPGHVEIYIGNGQRFGAHTGNASWDNQVSVGAYKSGYFTEFCRPY